MFLVMGVAGGLLGALLVVLNNAVTRFRVAFIPRDKPARCACGAVDCVARTNQSMPARVLCLFWRGTPRLGVAMACVRHAVRPAALSTLACLSVALAEALHT